MLFAIAWEKMLPHAQSTILPIYRANGLSDVSTFTDRRNVNFRGTVKCSLKWCSNYF